MVKLTVSVIAFFAFFWSTEAIGANELLSVWMHKELATLVDNGCNKAKDPTHCKITAASISNAESQMGNASKNAFWFTDGKYTTHKAAFDRWFRSYKKYWYKAKDPSWFYAERGKIPRTHYCMSEHSSNSKLGCPNGRKNAFAVFNKLKAHANERGKEENRKAGVVRQWAKTQKQGTTGALPKVANAKRDPSWKLKVEKFLSLKY